MHFYNYFQLILGENFFYDYLHVYSTYKFFLDFEYM